MTYKEWFDAHGEKHRAIVDKLLGRGFSDDEVIDYFAFENMVENEPDFCPLYAAPKKCHEIEKLNCYLCACPEFRFNDKGLRKEGSYLIKSECSIHNGSTLGHENVIHQDCSQCTVPHHRGYIKKHFNADWLTIMKLTCCNR